MALQIDRLDPDSVHIGDTNALVKVLGSGFTAHTIMLSDEPLTATTQYVNANRLDMTLPKVDGSPRTVTVFAHDEDTGDISNKVDLKIKAA